MPRLILKLKGEYFYKGLSLQSKFPIGGSFQQAENYDPFLKIGRLYPSNGVTRKDNQGGGASIGVPINAFDFYSNGINRFLFAFGDKTAGNIGAYSINLDTDAITDLVAAGVFANRTGFAEQCSMVKIWQGRIIYDERSGAQSLRSAATDGSDDKDVLTGLTSSHKHPSVIGPDGYLYVLNGPYIAQLVTASSTTNNRANAFDTLQSNLIGRDIDHDGQYIVAAFDSNSNQLSGIVSDCQVIFWDRSKSYAEVRWPIKEAYIIAVKTLGRSAYILTPSGWYVCSIATEPKLVYPMSSESPFNYFPTDYNGVSKNGHSIYWVDSTNLSSRLFAIGQKVAGKPKIIYSPYACSDTTGTPQALIISGDYSYSSCSNNHIFKLNSASGQSCTVASCPQYLPQAYTFSFTKIKLATALGSGDSVTHGLYNSDGEVISDNETQTYTSQAKKTLIFKRKAIAGAVNDFTDCYPLITTNVEIAEIEVYGEPLPGTHNIQY